MAFERGMHLCHPVERQSDSCPDRFARPFGVVAGPPCAASDPQGARQLGGEEVVFGLELLGSSNVVQLLRCFEISL